MRGAWSVAAGLACLCGLGSSASAQDEPKAEIEDEAASSAGDRAEWQLELSSGAEYDSNIHRVEVADGQDELIDASMLNRSQARYLLAVEPKKRQRLRLDLRGASKLFESAEGQSENIAILFADARYSSALTDSMAFVGARLSHYDVIDIRPFGEGVDPVPGRSFRSSEGELSFTLPSESGHRLTLLGGYRDFEYKPDADFDWSGEHLGIAYSKQWWVGDPDKDLDASSIDLRANLRVGKRAYEGAAFRNACPVDQEVMPECFVPTGELRSDIHHGALAEAVYTGDHIYSLLYAADYVDSNSFGQSILRQRVELGVTTELPGQIYLNARGKLRFNTFLDPLLLAQDVQSQSFVSIDEENRNSLALHLSRDLGPHWSVEGRYAIYSNEFATEGLRFRRQTAYLGALYRFQATE